MNDEVSVTIDSAQNAFVVKIGERTIAVPPRQFEQLLEASLSAAAQVLEAHIRSTGVAHKRNEATNVLRATGMEASSDLGAQKIITRMDVGPLSLRFALDRAAVIEYCAQVMYLIDKTDNTPPKRTQ